ncbi:regulatory phage cox family protein [Vibrio sp. S4M6]|uniref:helix-turn-helix domain-containing protein n=1 Tax=Vibrio sinus TaxID=2946865 RepID=UPI002029B4B7|nr:helix-turn-helix domain-containing protein [Vibrio sinus]MCL9782100.1 regulatory phage cox family protein [Vibrio sinus]
MIDHNDASGNKSFNHYAPFVTPEKYAELAGFSVDAVKCQVQNGKLPVIQREGGRRGRILINMKALEEFAEEQAQEFTHWKAAI